MFSGSFCFLSFFFFFYDSASTEIYTLSLHDALPISAAMGCRNSAAKTHASVISARDRRRVRRSEEHTSELQSRQYLVCRLLLEKKTNTIISPLPLKKKKKSR